MAFRRSLRTRVALAFAVFGGLVSLLMAIGLYVASYDLERRLVDEALTTELQDYISRRLRNPHSPPPATAAVRGYVTPSERFGHDIPASVRTLAPGRYAVELDGKPYRVAIANHAEMRFYLLYDESQVFQRQRAFLFILMGGVVLMTGLSAAGGSWLAGRVIAPVSTLARRVARLGPEAPGAPLARDYPSDEVGELARAFDRYLGRLHAFIERERAFTADVSHELRTPLAVVGGATEVMLTDPTLDERTRNRLQRIARSTRDMCELTAALLALAREAAVEAPPQTPCDVTEVLRDSIEQHRHLLANKPVTVELDVQAQPSLPVERTLLAVVLGNLLRNAFAYTECGEVRVVLQAAELRIEDTGAGIPGVARERVFERHYKGQGSSGSGIGLSLVKRVCERYGWQVALESEPGRGTSIRLQFAPPVDQASA